MLFPIFHIDPEMVFSSPWTDASCTWSLTTLSPFGSSWLSTRYSFKNLSLTKLANWWPKSMHRSMSCPNALWNSHQVSLRDPQIPIFLWRNFSLFTTPGILKSSLQDTWNLGQAVDSSLAIILVSSFLATHGMYLHSVLFSTEASLTRKSQARLFFLDLGFLECQLSFLLSTASSVSM